MGATAVLYVLDDKYKPRGLVASIDHTLAQGQTRFRPLKQTKDAEKRYDVFRRRFGYCLVVQESHHGGCLLPETDWISAVGHWRYLQKGG